MAILLCERSVGRILVDDLLRLFHGLVDSAVIETLTLVLGNGTGVPCTHVT